MFAVFVGFFMLYFIKKIYQEKKNYYSKTPSTLFLPETPPFLFFYLKKNNLILIGPEPLDVRNPNIPSDVYTETKTKIKTIKH